MPRVSKTRTFGPRKKYSLARASVGSAVTGGASAALGNQVNIDIVAAAAAQGKRKVKNFDIQLAVQQPQGEDTIIYYALVYQPVGVATPSPISVGGEFYSPPSHVLSAGLYDCSEGTGFRIRSRLARNLNAGDKIVLCLRATSSVANPTAFVCRGIVSYVVAYN